jgi:ribulose-5-phosphate 4-epimerase/fuculose-1-phosphate aldolase
MVEVDLAVGSAILDGAGLTTAFGHLSARHGDTVLFNTGDPPGEAAIHTAILAARANVMSVCRFHGPACLAWSTLGRPLPATTGMGLFLGASVPVFETQSTVRSPEHGAALAACLGDGNAVLLRGFGAVTVGRDVREAVARAWLLERSAAATLSAAAAGEPRPFDAAAATPFASGDGVAATQLERVWNWLRRRHT